MPTFPPRGLVADFCEQVVAHDLPELPPDRRDATVAFAGRRIAGLPSPMKLGRRRSSPSLVGGLGRVVGTGRVVARAGPPPAARRR